MLRVKKCCVIVVCFMWSSVLFAGQKNNVTSMIPGTNAAVFVCFTPQQNCTKHIIALINQAKKSIYVQAYVFTFRSIAKALVAAHGRGVNVAIILDKSQFVQQHNFMANYFKRHGIALWKDDQLNIAHNKVMIVDNQWVETGSFNFTYSAQHYNAENMLIINSKPISQLYLKNWLVAKNRSKAISSY